MTSEKDISATRRQTGNAKPAPAYDDQMLFGVLMSDLRALIKNGYAVTTANEDGCLVIRVSNAERIETGEGRVRLQPSRGISAMPEPIHIVSESDISEPTPLD